MSKCLHCQLVDTVLKWTNERIAEGHQPDHLELAHHIGGFTADMIYSAKVAAQGDPTGLADYAEAMMNGQIQRSAIIREKERPPEAGVH